MCWVFNARVINCMNLWTLKKKNEWESGDPLMIFDFYHTSVFQITQSAHLSAKQWRKCNFSRTHWNETFRSLKSQGLSLGWWLVSEEGILVKRRVRALFFGLIGLRSIIEPIVPAGDPMSGRLPRPSSPPPPSLCPCCRFHNTSVSSGKWWRNGLLRTKVRSDIESKWKRWWLVILVNLLILVILVILVCFRCFPSY